MSANEPIFGKPDPAATDNLPPELKGKTPQEIAAYYQRRESVLREQLRTAPKAEPKKEDPKPAAKIDIFGGDADGSIRNVVSEQVREEVRRVAGVAQPGIIAGCRTAMRDAHPDLWPKIGAIVEERMAQMAPEAQMNPQYWEFTFAIVKGEHTDKLVTEAREDERRKAAEAAAAANPVERPTPKGGEPPKPRELSDGEKTIATKFGKSNEEYRKAAELYDSEDGKLPFTYDSKKPRAKGSQRAKA